MSMSESLFQNTESIFLASGSPRRRELLKSLGISFSIALATVDETPFVSEEPNSFATRMAQAKTEEIAVLNPAAWVIGADTVVAVDGEIFGKPATKEKSIKMLTRLNGRTHKVYTGVCLQCAEKNIAELQTSCTEVTFGRFTEDVLEAYVETEDSLDKAGAYGVQGRGSFLVEKINGSCTGVIGLPLCNLVSLLLKYQAIKPA